MVESYENQIKTLEEQVNNLENLKSKFITLQYNFGARQDVRKKYLAGVSSKTAQIKTASQYYSGMTDLLNSSEFLNAYDGLSDGKDAILREQDKLFTQIEDLSAELNNRRQRITYWQTKLRTIKDK